MPSSPISSAAPRILIVRIGALGDVLHALPAVTALREALPAAHIGWAIEPRWQPLLSAFTQQGTALVDRIHLVPVQQWKSAPVSLATARSILALRSELRTERYTLAVDLQGTIRSAVVGRLAAAPTFTGSDSSRESFARKLYSQRVALTHPHVVEQACEILAAATQLPLTSAQPVLDPGPAARDWAASTIAALPVSNGIVVFSAGGGWGAKRWPAERFAAVAVGLSERGYLPVIAASTSENLLADQIVQASDGAARTVVCDIPQLTALLQSSALCIAGDTGPLHLAAAVGTPVVGIYGPTDPARNGPWTPHRRILRSPLSLTSHARIQQPESGLLTISARDVIHSALELLQSYPDIA